MDDNVGSTSATSGTGSTAATTGGASTSSTPSGSESWSTSTTINSLAELKEKAPKVYEAMMNGIGMNMVSKMRRDQEHLKQIMREGNRVFER